MLNAKINNAYAHKLTNLSVSVLKLTPQIPKKSIAFEDEIWSRCGALCGA
jgi:hypothetical protein